MGLRAAAERVKSRGTGGDDILAHINPHEAQFLAKTQGMSINPHTGMPEFGFFKKLEKTFRKPVKKIAPLAGSAIGMSMAGPLGAVIGGGVGKASTNKGNIGKNLLKGAITGLAYGAIAPGLGEMMGIDPSGLTGELMGVGGKSLWGQAAGLGQQFLGGKGAQREQPLAEQPFLGYSGGDEEKQEKNSIADFIQNAKPSTLLAIAGMLGQFAKKPKKQHETSLGDEISMIERARTAAQKPAPVQIQKRRYIPAPEGYRPGISPHHNYFQYEPQMHHFARGGHATARHTPHGYVHEGYIPGNSGGQTDDFFTKILEGSYIMDSTTTSLLGDGNSAHGAEKIKELEYKFTRGGIVRDEPSANTRLMDVALSDGEYAIKPEIVAAIGKGNDKLGAKKLDKFRVNVRKQKGVKAGNGKKIFLPPKTKPLHTYMR